MLMRQFNEKVNAKDFLDKLLMQIFEPMQALVNEKI